jgi:hypothetical protein
MSVDLFIQLTDCHETYEYQQVKMLDTGFHLYLLLH